MNKSGKKVISINITGIAEDTMHDEYSDQEKIELFDLIKESVVQINDAVKDLDDEPYDYAEDIDLPKGEWYFTLLGNLNYTKKPTEVTMKGILRDDVEDTLLWLIDYVIDEDEYEFSFYVGLDDEVIEDDFCMDSEKNLMKAALLSGYINWLIDIFDVEIDLSEAFEKK